MESEQRFLQISIDIGQKRKCIFKRKCNMARIRQN